MACHPLRVGHGGNVIIGAARTAEQGGGEVAGCAAEEGEGGPPVRGRVLVAVTVGSGVEDGEEGREGGVGLGEGFGGRD